MRNNDRNIYVIDADGGKPRRLTNHGTLNLSPVWSPDSQSIAFSSYRDRNWEIYVMDAKGKNLRRLTLQRIGEPDWFNSAAARPFSPTGKRATIWGQLKQLGRRLFEQIRP